MITLLYATITQSLTFLPLAIAISISYTMMKATDMALDGSFVLGAGIFARLVTLGYPPTFAAVCSLLMGSMGGIMVSLIQRGGKVDSLLAGILATFILTSANLALMGRPNISLLSQTTLFSSAFAVSDLQGWMQVALFCVVIIGITYTLLRGKFGLTLRALGDNPTFLNRLGTSVETHRLAGFAFTNLLAATSGMLTAQTVGYADIGMGAGMTLTGIGAILLGQQFFRMLSSRQTIRVYGELIACLIGVAFYFFAMNTLLRFNVDPVYLKMILGIILIFFLRSANSASTQEVYS